MSVKVPRIIYPYKWECEHVCVAEEMSDEYWVTEIFHDNVCLWVLEGAW